MPRSVQSVQRLEPAPKRASRRGASRKTKIYEIPKSPSCTISPRDASERSLGTHDVHEASSTASRRHQSLNTESTALIENYDLTPTQPKHSRVDSESFSLNEGPTRGFEALDAVNSLCSQLKDGQSEIARLRDENEKLLQQLHHHEARTDTLLCELKTEKDRTKKLQQSYEKEAQYGRNEAGEQLHNVVKALQSFSDAAHKLMPLLDVLTDAADIEYDDSTEHLYRILKEQKHQISTALETTSRKGNRCEQS